MQSKFSKCHPKHLTWIMPLCLSGIMSGSISFLNMLINKGMFEGFWVLWLKTWSLSWLMAFPLILIMLPLVRRFLLKFIIAKPSEAND